jgi:hypothetical protein
MEQEPVFYGFLRELSSPNVHVMKIKDFLIAFSGHSL